MNENSLKNLKRDGNIGHNKGGGRKPDWFKARAEMLLKKKDPKSRRDYLGFLYSVLHGEDFVQGVGSEGEVVPIPASIKDRLTAGRDLKEAAGRKALTELKQIDDDGKSIPFSIVIKTSTGDNGKDI